MRVDPNIVTHNDELELAKAVSASLVPEAEDGMPSIEKVAKAIRDNILPELPRAEHAAIENENDDDLARAMSLSQARYSQFFVVEGKTARRAKMGEETTDLNTVDPEIAQKILAIESAMRVGAIVDLLETCEAKSSKPNTNSASAN